MGEAKRGTGRAAWIGKKRHWIPLAFLAAGLGFALFSYLSPWPSALLIRAVFTDGANKTVAQMQPHIPPAGTLDATLDVQYAPGGSDTRLDLYSPSDSTGPLPTVVWIHGGAWISGNKENVDPYVQMIAAEGYTTASLNYTYGPEAVYPTAIHQLTAALEFLVDHADEYRIDPDRIVIAGDSAGAQLTSQLATMITSPAYADTVGVAPALDPDQLKGVILNCGIYDVSGIPDIPGIGGWGFRVALWSYLGSKDWANTPGGEEMSTIDDVTADFPPTWISGGNDDPLTPVQSKPFAAKLNGLGVDVTELFWPDDYEPKLPHEYQFHFDLGEAPQTALASTLEWLGKVME